MESVHHGVVIISEIILRSSLLVVNPQVVSFHNVTMNVNAIVQKLPVGLAVVNTPDFNVIASLCILEPDGARCDVLDNVSDLDEFHLGILLEEFNRASASRTFFTGFMILGFPLGDRLKPLERFRTSARDRPKVS
jgi:hypothetical protein